MFILRVGFGIYLRSRNPMEASVEANLATCNLSLMNLLLLFYTTKNSGKITLGLYLCVDEHVKF
jgi:hypothetical protein